MYWLLLSILLLFLLHNIVFLSWMKGVWRTDFTGKEDMFGCVSILKDLVPRELHFYSQAEGVMFSVPAHTMWCLFTPCGFLSILVSSNFLLSPLLWQLSREAIHPSSVTLSPWVKADRLSGEQRLGWIATSMAWLWCVPHLQKLPTVEREVSSWLLPAHFSKQFPAFFPSTALHQPTGKHNN